MQIYLIPFFLHYNFTYSHSQDKRDITNYLDEWLDAGATWIGGCCYIYPEDIASIKSHMYSKKGIILSDPGHILCPSI